MHVNSIQYYPAVWVWLQVSIKCFVCTPLNVPIGYAFLGVEMKKCLVQCESIVELDFSHIHIPIDMQFRFQVT